MIGDREHDILGAGEVGIKSCGVLWGYGDAEELTRAGADWIVEKPEEIRKLSIQ
jgi:phosphoglycolate phosphatase